MKKGIDVSAWQGVIDWAKVKTDGIEFAMVRLGYGSSTGEGCKTDKYFTANIEGALAAGIDVGIYFYSYAKSAAAAALEAAFAAEHLAPYKGRILYPVAYDLEDNGQKELGKATLTAMVKAFCGTIQDAGWYAALYCNTDWCRNRLDMDALKSYDLWLAQWTKTPTTAYTFGMWQHSSNGTVSGISGRVDLDFAYKDYPVIIKRAGRCQTIHTDAALPEKLVKDMTRAELIDLIREVVDGENPVYKDLKDVPDCWQAAARAMLDAGAINGGTAAEANPTDLNVRKETLKAAVIALAYHDAATEKTPSKRAEE